MPETVEARAVWIAAQIMEASGMCLHEHKSECRSKYSSCALCIQSFLLRKARKELKEEKA